MRTILLPLLAVMISAAYTMGATDVALVALSIQTYEQVETIRSEMHDAVGDLSDEKRAYELAIRELNAEPKSQEQLDELAADIKRHWESLNRFQNGDGAEASTAYSRKRVRDLTLILEASKIKTDDERDAFRQKYQPEIDELAAKIRTLEAPFQKLIRNTQEPVNAENEALINLIRPYIKAPDSSYPGSTVQSINATVHMAFGSSNWNDSDDNQIAWAHIRIRSLDEIEDYHRENLLDGTYPIQSLSDGSIWVWAGHFLITFVADDDALKGKENIQQAIHEFIDLEGLASIQAAQHAELETVATGSAE